jgi:hypothetical protein
MSASAAAASPSEYRVQNPVEGVYIISRALDDFATFREDAERLRTYGKRGVAIFNAKSGNDRRRMLRTITPRFGKMCKLIAELHRLIKNILPVIGWSADEILPNDTTVITSKPDCMEQEPHTDYDVGDAAFAKAPLDALPFSVLLAIDDGTKFVVYGPAASCVKEDRQELTLNAGDLLFFRGDIVHSGASYSKPNSRVHVYVDRYTIARAKNESYMWSWDS